MSAGKEFHGVALMIVLYQALKFSTVISLVWIGLN